MIEKRRARWEEIQDRPSEYPPAPHTHADADITSLDWSKILNKPSTFPPAPHQHGDADLTGIDWSKVQNKPPTYPPSPHTHSIDDIIGTISEKNLIYETTYKPVGAPYRLDIDISLSPDDLYMIVDIQETNASDCNGWKPLYILPNKSAYDNSFQKFRFIVKQDNTTSVATSQDNKMLFTYAVYQQPNRIFAVAFFQPWRFLFSRVVGTYSSSSCQTRYYRLAEQIWVGAIADVPVESGFSIYGDDYYLRYNYAGTHVFRLYKLTKR